MVEKKFFVILIAVVAMASLLFAQKARLCKFLSVENTPFSSASEKRRSGATPQTASTADLVDLTWEAITTSAPWSVRDSHTSYIFDNKLWLLGGLDATKSTRGNTPNYKKANYYNDIWSSVDGKEWVRETEHANFPPIRSVSITLFKDTLYMIGGWSPAVGYKNGIWKSTNGFDWIKVVESPPYGEREGQKVVVFKDRMWLIGGVNYSTGKRKTFNDVWSSEDGVRWTVVSSAAPWHSRWDHDVVVFKDGLWVIGGMDLNNRGYGDVWYSSDGKEWQLITKAAPFGKRQGHGVVVFNGLMWVVGGLEVRDIRDIWKILCDKSAGDVWYTTNGHDWMEPKSDKLWISREDHEVIVFKDAIWVMGGMDKSFRWNNDVWRSVLDNL